MQARATGSVKLFTHANGKPRKHPIWKLRYRLPDGKQSNETVGSAWIDQELWERKRVVKLLRSTPKPGFLTEAQARAAGQAWLDEHSGIVPDDRKTFGRACEDYILYCVEEKKLRQSTMHEYNRIVKSLFTRPWSELTWRERPLGSFTEDDLAAVRQELMERGLSAHSLNVIRGVLRGAFGDRPVVNAWRWSKVQPKESKGKLHVYTPEEAKRLIEHAADDRDRAVFTLAFEEGLRMSEIRGLKLHNVDFKHGMLHVEDGFTTKGGHAGTKSHRARAIPLTKHSYEYLKPICEGRAQHVPDPDHPGKDKPVLVFMEADGRELDYYALRKRYLKAIQNAGLHRIRMHELRHTFGTRMIKNPDVDIYALQRLMGHARITTTEIYLHFEPDVALGNSMSEMWGD